MQCNYTTPYVIIEVCIIPIALLLYTMHYLCSNKLQCVKRFLFSNENDSLE